MDSIKFEWRIIFIFVFTGRMTYSFKLLQKRALFWLRKTNLLLRTPVKIVFQVFKIYLFNTNAFSSLFTSIINSCFKKFKLFWTYYLSQFISLWTESHLWIIFLVFFRPRLTFSSESAFLHILVFEPPVKTA